MKDIKNYEGLYAVTEDGRVWSYKRQKFLKLGHHHSGYLNVRLYKNGIGKTYSVHTCVAEAYIPNPDNLPCVNHRDENKQNNSVDNLEWCTVKYNTNYGTSIQRSHEKLKKAIYCRELDEIFSSAGDAAEQLGLKRPNIWCALSGRSKTAGGYHFEYLLER